MAAGDKQVGFDAAELRILRFALVQFEKSILRAAAKPGQPENVAAEFRKSAETVSNLIRKMG